MFLGLATADDLCDEGTVFVTLPQEPKTFMDAMASEDRERWMSAKGDELASHAENHTYEYVVVPRGLRLVDNMWIYKVKEKAGGSMDKMKAGLLARGFT